MTTHILAIDDAIQAIVMVVVMVLMGLGGILKKRSRKPGQGKTLIIPSLESDEPKQPRAPQARPSAPSRPGTAPHQPMTQPQARPTPVARQQPPQVRPTPIQQPARPARRIGELARPQPVPSRPDKVARPRPVREPAPPGQSMPSRGAGRQAHRVRAADHAKTVAAHAEHVASRLREEQLRQAGELAPGEHAHGQQPAPRRQMHPLLSLLNPQDMKQAIILSEIIQPPLALRENDRTA